MRISTSAKNVIIYAARLTFGFTLLSGCGPTNFTTSPSPANAIASSPEAGNCTPVSAGATPVTITGDAIYFYRTTHSTIGLNGNPVSADIRFAEIAIYNSSGSLIQCGETDNNGDFSLQIPKVAGTYRVQVNSRSAANSTKVSASVLEDIYSNQVYSVSKSFTVASNSVTVAVGTVEAKARLSESPKLEGGAFFIFDNILWANERIRTLISDANFIAPKAQIYWRAGFNPYSYFGYPNSLSSFYINGERKIYILGGKNGDVKNSDTDHFDASVVLHEYGHFLEDVYGKSESPGGSHNGDSVIDPRLAWSEGWGNYIQAELLNGRYFSKNLYIDTIGFKNDTVEGSYAGAGIGIKFDLATDGATSLYDGVSMAGEGTFRELSVSRTLYKTTAPASATSGSKGAGVPFSAIWNTFKSVASGFGTSSSIIFRSVGYFNEFLYNYININHNANLADWTTIVLSDERQNTSRVDFASPVSTAAVCAKYPRSITPIVDEDYNGQYYKSNHLRSNDFYTFYYTGLGTQSISLNYSQIGVQTIDLDLILYKSNFKIIEDEQEFSQGYSNPYYAVRSRRLNPSVETGSESISLVGLTPGYYLINVKAVTYNRNTGAALSGAQLNGTASYNLNLTTNSTTEFLCPAH